MSLKELSLFRTLLSFSEQVLLPHPVPERGVRSPPCYIAFFYLFDILLKQSSRVRESQHRAPHRFHEALTKDLSCY